jgi:hypothetical protein
LNILLCQLKACTHLAGTAGAAGIFAARLLLLSHVCHMFVHIAGQPQLPLLNAVRTWLGQQVQAAMINQTYHVYSSNHLLCQLNACPPAAAAAAKCCGQVQQASSLQELTVFSYLRYVFAHCRPAATATAERCGHLARPAGAGGHERIHHMSAFQPFLLPTKCMHTTWLGQQVQQASLLQDFAAVSCLRHVLRIAGQPQLPLLNAVAPG